MSERVFKIITAPDTKSGNFDITASEIQINGETYVFRNEQAKIVALGD